MKMDEKTETKIINVTEAIMQERKNLLNAINGSGLPATVSELVLREVSEAVHERALMECAEVEKEAEENGIKQN